MHLGVYKSQILILEMAQIIFQIKQNKQGNRLAEIIGKEAQKAIDNVLSDSIGKAFKIRPNVSNNFKRKLKI